MLRPPTILAALLVVFALGCDTQGEALDTTYVVESVLVAGQPLPPILFSQVGNLDDKFDFGSYAESGAQVAIHVEGAKENTTIEYRELEQAPGVYIAAEYLRPVFPLHKYSLAIQPKGPAPLITAETVVPDTFSIVRNPLSAVIYLSEERLELDLTRSEYPGREQDYYIIVTEALEPIEDNLVPFAFDLYNDGEGESLEELRISGSPIINESNYTVNEDGTLTVRYPWIAVRFFGLNAVHVNALDDNVYNFERSRSVQEGGSTFAPGEIPNPLPHIRHAHGIFGSQARVSFIFTVLAE